MINFRKLFRREKRLEISSLNATLYFKLGDQEKRNICQKLEIYNPEHFRIFDEVDRLFSEKYSSVEGIEASQCGLAPILGPSNCIKVFIPRHTLKVVLPKYFEGFPVISICESRYRTYRTMVERVTNKMESA